MRDDSGIIRVGTEAAVRSGKILYIVRKQSFQELLMGHVWNVKEREESRMNSRLSSFSFNLTKGPNDMR